jgi:hypothetical protein
MISILYTSIRLNVRRAVTTCRNYMKFPSLWLGTTQINRRRDCSLLGNSRGPGLLAELYGTIYLK